LIERADFVWYNDCEFCLNLFDNFNLIALMKDLPSIIDKNLSINE